MASGKLNMAYDCVPQGYPLSNVQTQFQNEKRYFANSEMGNSLYESCE